MKELGNDLVFANWRGFFAPPGTPQSKIEKRAKLLSELVETDAFERVRARNGWSVMYRSGDEFYHYLEHQEKELREIMLEIGFLKK